MTREIYTSFLCLAVLGFCSCSQKTLVTAKPKSDPGQVAPRNGYFNAGLNLFYNVFQSDDSLYIQLATSDLATKVKITALGFHLWIDPKGRKRKVLGVNYPRKNPKALMNTGYFNTRTDQEDILVEIGFRREGSRRGYRLGRDQPHVNVKIHEDSENMLTYRLAFPKNQLLPKLNEKTVFSIGLSSGSMASYEEITRAMKNTPAFDNSERSSNPPPKPVISGEDFIHMRSQLAEPVDFWFKVKL